MYSYTDKEQIKEALKAYVKRYDSQNAAANSLKGVSSATISQILNDNWELIKDTMWRNIAAQIGYTKGGWPTVETTDYKTITKLFTDAQHNSLVVGVTGEAGSGKSHRLRDCGATNKGAYLWQGNE